MAWGAPMHYYARSVCDFCDTDLPRRLSVIPSATNCEAYTCVCGARYEARNEPLRWQASAPPKMAVQTTLRPHMGEPWDLPRTTRYRRVGWLDQKGRIYLDDPPAANFDGGGLTPLLVPVDEPRTHGPQPG